MERLTTDEIIQLGLMNRATLIYKVRNELVVAYDDKNKPIDLKEKERKFLDIQRLCEPETHTEQQTRPKRTPNPFTGGRQLFGSETGEEKSFAVEKKYRRIFVIPDQYPTQVGMITNVWIDWDILHSTLSSRDIKDLPVNIAFSQEQAILKGWNNDRVFDFIKEATFSEDDINKRQEPIMPTHPSTTNATQSKQKEEWDNDLLKIIGAFVEVHYMGKPQYMLGDRLNAAAVKEHLHKELSEKNFQTRGMEDRSLRGKIKEARRLFNEDLPLIILAAQEELQKNKTDQS